MGLRKLSAVMVACVVVGFASAALGEGTRTWEQSKFDELVKGTAHGVAIRSSGGLELAPAFKALYTSPSTYIWAIAADSNGDVFAATGAPARVYEVTADGQSSVIFEPQELQVQALLVDKSGALFAATAPDGKVYKIERHAPISKKEASPKKGPVPEAKAAESAWSSHVYFDPGTKYIWDLAQDNSGNLYVGTGDHGEVYRVTPRGEHSLFFKSDEVHIRVLDIDPKGNVIAGSDGSGLVYRISPSGQAFVLYSAPKKEITALAIDNAGNIYAAGAGEKRPGSGPGSGNFSAATITPTGPNPTPGQMGMSMGNPPGGGSAMMGSFPAPGAGATGGSEIYRIAPDGSPTKIWSSRDDLVYALGFDQRGRLLAGTGNRGHIFAIVGEEYFIDLLKAGASQITSFAKAPGGGLYVSTSNLGKLFLLGPAPESEGSYESDVFDAHIFSRWGRAEFRGVGNVELLTRSGNVDNPDRNWSPWTKVDIRKDGEAAVPAARFIQWKTVLRAGTPAPRLDSVLLNYLPKNVAPTIEDVSVQVGTRYQSLPKPMGGVDQGSTGGNPTQPRFEPPVPSVHDRDSIGVKWTAHDDNDDQMVYSVYYRGDGESRWLLLKDNLTEKFYSFDASLLPDGGYTIKVVASDAPSHSLSEALSSEKESPRFEVDTTPPRIENLNAAVDGNQIRVTFGAVDSYSPIKRAEYSVDAGEWQFVEPVGQLSDSRSETYDFKVSVPSGEAKVPARGDAASGNGADGDPVTAGSRQHVIVIRVYDRFDNMSSIKAVTRAK